jgi:hypothetical protein
MHDSWGEQGLGDLGSGVSKIFEICRLLSGYPFIQSAFFFKYELSVGHIGADDHFSALLSATKPGTSPFCWLFHFLSVPMITRDRLLPTTALGPTNWT